MRNIIATIVVALPLIFLSGCGGGDSETTTTGDVVTNILDIPPADLTPITDPYERYQWSHQYTPDLSSYVDYGSDMQIKEVLDNVNRGEGITIAIIDTCFDLSHEDAPDNIVATYDIETGTSDVSCRAGDNPHGISVSGVVGAPDNGIGLVGVAPNAKYILIRMPSTVTVSELYDAFIFAKDNGANIISNSWGTGAETSSEADIFAYMKQNDIVVLFACGNNAQSLDTAGVDEECEDPNVIGIGSSNEVSEITSYSNYGSNMDFLASAGEYGIVSIDQVGSDGYNIDNLSTLNNNDYTYFAGTSASTPVATGVVALMIHENPFLSVDEVYDILRATADKIGPVSYDVSGWNDTYAYGRINAYNAVMEARNRSLNMY